MSTVKPILISPEERAQMIQVFEEQLELLLRDKDIIQDEMVEIEERGLKLSNKIIGLTETIQHTTDAINSLNNMSGEDGEI